MQVQLYRPFGYSETGGRANNEDFIFPDSNSASIENRLFIVCDGVGGAEKGEIASELASKSFAKFFEENDIRYSDENTINQALNFVEESFDNYFIDNPSSNGMATTATLLHIHAGGATVAHIGDSRVYLVRNGRIIFQTKDHSFVMELFEAGFITLEEAQKHPRKNEITRAIQGKNVKPTHADVTVIDDLKAGDVFILCTDGVLERVNENLLEDVVFQYNDPSMIGQALINISMGQTRDNFSAYVVKIDDIISGNRIVEYSEAVSDNTQLTEQASGEELIIDEGIQTSSQKKNRIWLLMLMIATVVFFAGFVVYNENPYGLLDRIQQVEPKPTQAIIPKPILERKPDTPVKADSILKVADDAKPDKEKEAKSNEYEVVHKWNGFLTLIKKGNAYGLKSTNNKNVKVKPEFDRISDKGVMEGYTWAVKEGKFGFIHIGGGKEGIRFLNARYDSVLSVAKNGKEAVVISDGKKLTLDLQEEFKSPMNRKKIKFY